MFTLLLGIRLERSSSPGAFRNHPHNGVALRRGVPFAVAWSGWLGLYVETNMTTFKDPVHSLSSGNGRTFSAAVARPLAWLQAQIGKRSLLSASLHVTTDSQIATPGTQGHDPYQSTEAAAE